MIGKPHPWHGISPGADAPEQLMAFIEMTPYDTVKYEIDKISGYLKVDRPHKFSSLLPALYGFIPQTYCSSLTAEYFQKQSPDAKVLQGDKDPLDICVLSDRNIHRSNIIVPAIPIGGFRMLDGGEADDKIIAVLASDEFYVTWNDVSELPQAMVDRLKHYFLNYKQMPGDEARVEIVATYGREEAHEVIRHAMADYKKKFNGVFG
jgi:inorganic pyrophosphatase